MDWESLINATRVRKSSGSVIGDQRNAFESDYDRAVFSTPLKRLQDKAQVFPLEKHDAVRTRLTHSLEVASVARGIAIAVGKWLLAKEGSQRIKQGTERSIEAIAATCGLIHDLGNPPFGHSGEDAIRAWFAKRFPITKEKEKTTDPLEKLLDNDQQLAKDFRTFEGNAQSLRLVAKLQLLADPHGLNLTYGTLSAASKYLASSINIRENAHAFSKTGYFKSEEELVEDIRYRTGTGDARNPITFIVEAADDIVYSVADVEDGVKKGVLTWELIQKRVEELEKNNESVNGLLAAKENILKAGQTSAPSDLPDDIHASAFRTATIGKMVVHAVDKFKKHYGEIMEGNFEGELIERLDVKSPTEKDKTHPLVAMLKSIGQQFVYCTDSTLKLELMGRHVICDLMDLYWEGAQEIGTDRSNPPKPKKFAGKVGRLFSDNYLRVFYNGIEDGKFPENYLRMQLVTDQVCGMTDSFAKTLHAELFNG